MDSELVLKTAKLIAIAYWRGRMEGMREKMSPVTFEAMIKAAAEKETDRWLCSARAIDD